jgi:DNA-binding protein H-NS
MEQRMSNLIDIQSQIEKLQKQAQEIRSKEFSSTVQDILAKMQAFGITVKDLQSAKPGKTAKTSRARGKSTAGVKSIKVPKKSGAAVTPKFRGPNGETWSGRGLTPKWMSALIAQGQPKESFAIHA